MSEQSIFWDKVGLFSSIILTIIALISEEYRLYAMMAGLAFIMVIAIQDNYSQIQNLKSENQRLIEKLKIYKELIDIKTDIKLLKDKIKNEI